MWLLTNCCCIVVLPRWPVVVWLCLRHLKSSDACMFGQLDCSNSLFLGVVYTLELPSVSSFDSLGFSLSLSVLCTSMFLILYYILLLIYWLLHWSVLVLCWLCWSHYLDFVAWRVALYKHNTLASLESGLLICIASVLRSKPDRQL